MNVSMCFSDDVCFQKFYSSNLRIMNTQGLVSVTCDISNQRVKQATQVLRDRQKRNTREPSGPVQVLPPVVRALGEKRCKPL